MSYDGQKDIGVARRPPAVAQQRQDLPRSPQPDGSPHTPGPWRLWLSEDDRGAFMLHGDSREPHGADMVIAQRHIGTPNGDEGVANARLIAASPDLLQAAKDTMDYWDSNGFSDCEEGCHCIVDVMRAAIAKAEVR